VPLRHPILLQSAAQTGELWRITGIAAGTYAQSVLIPAASDEVLDAFLAEHRSSPIATTTAAQRGLTLIRWMISESDRCFDATKAERQDLHPAKAISLSVNWASVSSTLALG
jgi:hypothetical protein